jgi:hypothetical protein
MTYDIQIEYCSIRVILGVILGAWSIYNGIHPTRENNVANLAVDIN